MSRILDIRQNQVTALCKGAAKAGFVPVIQFGNTTVRLVPDIPIANAQAAPKVDEDEDIRL